MTCVLARIGLQWTSVRTQSVANRFRSAEAVQRRLRETRFGRRVTEADRRGGGVARALEETRDMASDTGIRLTVRSVDALTARGRDTLYWDRDLPGFGVRVYRTGRKVYVAQARGPSGTRRAVVGRHGKMQPKVARRAAAAMIDRIRRGEDPVPPEPEPEPTVADLAERYMKAHVEVNCRPSSIDTLGRIVRLYVVPELGELPVSGVDRSHVSALHDRMRDKPYQANRTVDVVARMFSLAEAWELVPPGRNPCRSVRRYRESRRERFLTADEYRRVGAALDRGGGRRLARCRRRWRRSGCCCLPGAARTRSRR